MEFKTAQSIPGLILFLASTGHTKISDNGNLKLPYGEITGKVHSDYFAFFGLPYAEPPTGARRWQPAEPYTTSWTNTRDASNKQNVPGCYQPDNGSAPEKMSEDCLFLNVYTPKNSDGKSLPVMLWIHGGSWQHGHGNTDIYDGESLVKKDVVLVTINYRLGSFGFLYDEEATGNRLSHRRRKYNHRNRLYLKKFKTKNKNKRTRFRSKGFKKNLNKQCETHNVKIILFRISFLKYFSTLVFMEENFRTRTRLNSRKPSRH